MKFFIYLLVPVCIQAQIIINEFMPYPQTGNLEWIELHNPDSLFAFTSSMIWIEDATSKSRIENVHIPPLGYLIICRDTTLLKHTIGFVSCQLRQSSLPTLNNTYDKIKIRNQDSIIIDSIAYVFKKEFRGKSMERYEISRKKDSLTISISPTGHTCGFINACNPQDHDLLIESIIGQNDEISITLYNNGNSMLHDLSIIIITDSSRNQKYIPTLESKGRVKLNISMNDIHLSRGLNEIYLESIHSEQDPRPYNNNGIFSHYQSFPKRSIIINEINAFEHTYQEYVELRIMDSSLLLIDGYACIIGTDTIALQVEEASEYVLLTKDNKWSIPSNATKVFHQGLALSNSGSIIQIIDPNGFVIDSIDYTPHIKQYGNYLSNHSLEYIESLDGGNWFISLIEHGGSPGEPNSRINQRERKGSAFRLMKCTHRNTDCKEIHIIHPFTIGIYSCDMYTLDGFHVQSIIVEKLISGDDIYSLPVIVDISPSAYILVHTIRNYFGTDTLREITPFIKRN